MTLNKTKEVYFINPEIIVSVKHFIKIEHVKNDPKKSWGPSLIMRFDKTGTDTWSIATDKAIGKKLALIIDNGLV